MLLGTRPGRGGRARQPIIIVVCVGRRVGRVQIVGDLADAVVVLHVRVVVLVGVLVRAISLPNAAHNPSCTVPRFFAALQG